MDLPKDCPQSPPPRPETPPSPPPPLYGVIEAVSEVHRENSIIHMHSSKYTQPLIAALAISTPRNALLILPSHSAVLDMMKMLHTLEPTLNLKTYTLPMDSMPHSFDILMGTMHALVHSSFRKSLTTIRFSLVVVDAAVNFALNHSLWYLVNAINARSEPQPRYAIISVRTPVSANPVAAGPSCITPSLLSLLAIRQKIFVNGDHADYCVVRALHVAKPRPAPPKSLAPIDIRHTPTGAPTLHQRDASQIHTIFFRRVRDGTATRFATRLVKMVLQLEQAYCELDGSFSPQVQTGLPSHSWRSNTYRHQQGRLANSLRAMCTQLQYWYEALHFLLTSWEHADWASVTLLQLVRCNSAASFWAWPTAMNFSLVAFWGNDIPHNLQPLNRLKSVLLSNMGASPKLRTIVLVETWVLTHVVDFYVNRNVSSFQPAPKALAAYTPDGTVSSFVMNSTMAERNLGTFCCGDADVLVTTPSFHADLKFGFPHCLVRMHSGLEGFRMESGPHATSKPNVSLNGQRQFHGGRYETSLQSTHRASRHDAATRHAPEDRTRPSAFIQAMGLQDAYLPLYAPENPTGLQAPGGNYDGAHQSSSDWLEASAHPPASGENDRIASSSELYHARDSQMGAEHSVGLSTPGTTAARGTDAAHESGSSPILVPDSKLSNVEHLLGVDENGVKLCEEARNALHDIMKEREEPSDKHPYSATYGKQSTPPTKKVEPYRKPSGGMSPALLNKSRRGEKTGRGSGRLPAKPSSANRTSAPMGAADVASEDELTHAQVLVLERRYRGILTRPLDGSRKAHSSLYAFAAKVGGEVRIHHITTSEHYVSEMTYTSLGRFLSAVAMALSRKEAREKAADKLLASLIDVVSPGSMVQGLHMCSDDRRV